MIYPSKLKIRIPGLVQTVPVAENMSNILKNSIYAPRIINVYTSDTSTMAVTWLSKFYTFDLFGTIDVETAENYENLKSVLVGTFDMLDFIDNYATFQFSKSGTTYTFKYIEDPIDWIFDGGNVYVTFSAHVKTDTGVNFMRLKIDPNLNIDIIGT